jgi:hypothetical protein
LFKSQGLLKEKYRLLAIGEFDTMLCAGPPAGGKSFLAEQQFTAAKRRYKRIRVNAVKLVEVLHKYRHKQYAVLLDECDGAWSSIPQMNILKDVLDSHNKREVYDAKLGHFTVEAAVALACNSNIFDPALTGFESKCHEHIRAILTRCNQHHPMTFDPVQQFHFSCWLATDGASLMRNLTDRNSRQLKLTQINEVLEWFADNFRKLNSVSIRTLLDVAKLRLISEQWTELAAGLLSGNRTGFVERWEVKRPVRSTKPVEPVIVNPVEVAESALELTDKMREKKRQQSEAGKKAVAARMAKKRAAEQAAQETGEGA